MLWPRRSWARSAKYVTKRILRLTASPHAIAAGVGAGVFASFTPLLGFHFMIAFMVAYIIGGNFLAAALGTFFGNPISFPFIWASTYETGSFILGVNQTVSHEEGMDSLANTDVIASGFAVLWDTVIGLWEPLVKPMLIGAIPLGVTFGIAAYLLTRWAAVVFRRARMRRIAKSGATA